MAGSRSSLMRLIGRAFNRTVDAVIGAPSWAWRLAGYAVLAGLAFLLVHRHVAEARSDGAQAVRDSLAAVTAIRLHRQKDSLGIRIVRESVTVTRTVQHQDTLWKQLPESIATRADTVQVLNALPALRASSDSTVHACTELLDTCALFRRAADSLDVARQAQIAALERTIGTLRPSKWSTVAKWAEIGLAGYAGFRLGRSR